MDQNTDIKDFIKSKQFKNIKIPYYYYVFNKKTIFLLFAFIYLLFISNKSLLENILFVSIGIYIIYDYLKNPHNKKNYLEGDQNFLVLIVEKVKKKAYKK